MNRMRQPGPAWRSPKSAGISLLLVLTLFVGAGLNQVITQVTTASDRFSSASNYSIIGETYDAIRENYVLQADFTDEQLVWGAASGMIESLGDTGHSTFLNPDEAKQWQDKLSNDLIGIGISVNTQGKLPVVNFPLKNSPALKAGIQPGDTILEVDGTDLSTMPATDAVDLITGEAGTDVTLKLIHAGETEPYTVTITREKIELDPVSYAMLPNGVLWLRLDQFSQGASTRVAEALEWGKEQGMTGVVLDLRFNPGGYVSEAQGVASQFLPNGTPLYQEMDNTGAKHTVTTLDDKGRYLEGPLVVLVNADSKSAAEITSSALQEAGRAQLVGETTGGTGTVLLPFDLSDGSIAILGIELFLTGAGNDIYHKGVVPDHEVEFSDNPTDYPKDPALLLIDGGTMKQADFDKLADPQLKSAIDLLGQ